jgi:hypothetical protein
MGRGHQGGEREDRMSAAVPVQTVAPCAGAPYSGLHLALMRSV